MATERDFVNNASVTDILTQITHNRRQTRMPLGEKLTIKKET